MNGFLRATFNRQQFRGLFINTALGNFAGYVAGSLLRSGPTMKSKSLKIAAAVAWLLHAAALTACSGGSDGSTAPQPSAPTASIVFMGDSITYLWDQPSWVQNPDDVLSAHLPQAVDVGISGQTCEQMYARFAHDVIGVHPDVVVIDCGTNDVFHLDSLATESYLFDMVQAAEASGIRVIVGLMPPDAYVYGSAGWNMHAQWNADVTAGAADYGYIVADYYTPMLLPDGHRNDTIFATGSAHPNAAGYAIMWNVLQPLLLVLQPLLLR
jgi:lysophospholipase L1-like esterase